MRPTFPSLPGNPSVTTVLFIEDHLAIIEYGSQQLRAASPRLRLLTAATGAEGLALSRAHAPDVVLLDLSLPDGDGLDLIGTLRTGPQPPAVVIFTGRSDDAMLRRLELAGVAGVLWKGSDAGTEMVDAVQRVLAGETHVSPYFVARFDATKLVASRAVAQPEKSRERIVVVKSHRLRADGIARAAREVFPEAEVTLCYSAAEAEASLRAEPATLGVIGLTLPDRDGLDLLVVAERERWCRRILVVSDRRDERTRQGLRSAQIDGCFDIAVESSDQLVVAIRRVAEGGVYFSAGVLGSASVVLGGPTTVAQLLTDTELRVFAVVGDGSDDGQAAARLGLSDTTVHNHRQRIMRKLGVQSRTDLMREAMRRGVVRFTETGGVLTPGLERTLADRAALSRDPIGAGGKD
jgi:DNA-binding NarL/FixJ family response regulator